MTKLTYHTARGRELVYEIPPDVDVHIYPADDEHHTDFDFAKDGEIVAKYGGRGEDGNVLPTWRSVGIRWL